MTAEEKLAEIEKTLRNIVATIDKHYERDADGRIIDRFYEGYSFAMSEILNNFFEEPE